MYCCMRVMYSAICSIGHSPHICGLCNTFHWTRRVCVRAIIGEGGVVSGVLFFGAKEVM